MSISKNTLMGLLCSTALATTSGAAFAQDAETSDVASDEAENTIVVIGTQIQGADIEGDLPVTVVDIEELDAIGVNDGDELLRSIPQIGSIGFGAVRGGITGVNAARGDVASFNLRSIGDGNTLVLINGRRMVLHPITQVSNVDGVPVATANANTIPTGALRRVEVLRDGAAALYGADAVAGVINYVFDDDYEGTEVSAIVGLEDDGGREDYTIRAKHGFRFNEDRTSIVLSGSYSRRDGVLASEKDFAANADLRLRAPEQFRSDTSLDQRSSLEVFPLLSFNGLGRFHLRPATLLRDNGSTLTIDDCGGRGLTGAQTTFSDGTEDLCLDSSGQDRALRPNRNEDRTLTPDVERYNFFGSFTHELSSNVELFGEVDYYFAKTERQWEQASILSNGRFFVPADYYYNPFGPVTFDDGRVNPNRLPGLDTSIVPEEGLGFELQSLRPVDVGPRTATIKGESYRLVAGLRGNFSDWDYDTAFVHSVANVEDVANNRISTPLLQQSLSLDTPNAYNIFTGVNPSNPASITDFTPNPRASIDPFIVSATREAQTILTMADFRVSNSSIIELPAGDVALGLGVEWRDERLDEDNSSIFDGSIPFIDPLDASLVPGEVTNLSSLQGSSLRTDIQGDRQVFSAYGELLIPVLADQPLFYALDIQAAVRFEHFSDTGSITRPKVAVAWSPIEAIKFRGSYSLGFRAPNLVQLNTIATSITTSVDDYAEGILLGTGDINDGPSNGNYILESAGNPNLQPERSQNLSAGVVLTPVNGLTITADYWRIRTNGTVSVLSDENVARLDALLRSQGSSNPNVIRGPVDADNPLGPITIIRRQFDNLNNRVVEGLDLSLVYALNTGIGTFTTQLNGAHLMTFDQTPGEVAQSLIDFGADPTVLGNAAGSLIRREFFPKWRATGSLTWRSNDDLWSATVFGSYVSSVFEPSVTDADGNFLTVPSYTRIDASISKDDFFNEGLSARIGVRNVFDEDPPLSVEAFGFEGELHSPLGRYFFFGLTKTF